MERQSELTQVNTTLDGWDFNTTVMAEDKARGEKALRYINDLLQTDVYKTFSENGFLVTKEEVISLGNNWGGVPTQYVQLYFLKAMNFVLHKD